MIIRTHPPAPSQEGVEDGELGGDDKLILRNFVIWASSFRPNALEDNLI